jgi:hypothetical protein
MSWYIRHMTRVTVQLSDTDMPTLLELVAACSVALGRVVTSAEALRWGMRRAVAPAADGARLPAQVAGDVVIESEGAGELEDAFVELEAEARVAEPNVVPDRGWLARDAVIEAACGRRRMRDEGEDSGEGE